MAGETSKKKSVVYTSSSLTTSSNDAGVSKNERRHAKMPKDSRYGYNHSSSGDPGVGRDLKDLRESVKQCEEDVRLLRILADHEAKPDDYVDLNIAVSCEIEEVRRRYCRVLRKQVAVEMYKVQGVLEQLRKYESHKDWINRGHRQLLRLVSEYNDQHLRSQSPVVYSVGATQSRRLIIPPGAGPQPYISDRDFYNAACCYNPTLAARGTHLRAIGHS